MGLINNNARRVRNAALAVSLVLAQILPIAVQGRAFAKVDDEQSKIRICHRTASYTNPYVELEVDKNAVDGVAGNSGQTPDHYGEHQGPIFYTTIPKHTEWGDIIPPILGVHSGLNWTTEGRNILENHCEFPSGTIKVNKKVDADGNGVYEGSNGTANTIGFDWGYDDESPARDMGTSQNGVLAGDHTITEKNIPNYAFTGWFYTNDKEQNCSKPEGTTLPAQVKVKKDKTTEITLCNQKQVGSITIKKDAIPHTDTDFKFTTNATPNIFYLDDEPGAGQDQTPEQKTFNNLKPDTYTFTEDEVAGWWLKKIECNEGAEVEVDGNTLTVYLASGQNVTCTFKNHKKGVIKVTKQTYPNGSQKEFEITASGTGSITGEATRNIQDDQTILYDVTYGTYEVNEDVPYGWKQKSNNCYNLVIDEKNLERSCTIVNELQKGSITVIKNVDTDGDGKVDVWDSTYWNWDINGQGDYKTGSENSQKVQAGVYTVSEQQKSNYHVSESNCTGEEPMYVALEAIQVQVSALENVVCTFTNTRDTGKVKVVKHLIPKEDDGRFNLHINGYNDFTEWNVGNYGSTGFVTVVTGNYNVSESAYEGTWLKDYKSKYECKNARGYTIAEGYGSESEEFYVGKDAYITCHFYNKRKPRLTVEKVAIPHDAQDFHFNVDKAHDDEDENNEDEENELPLWLQDNEWQKNWQSDKGYNFYLDDGYDDDEYSDEWSKTIHHPGQFVITEDQVEGWDLKDISCYKGDYQLETDWVENGVKINLEFGDDIRCVFTNVKRGKLIVTKYNDLNKDKCFKDTLYTQYEEEIEEDWDDDYQVYCKPKGGIKDVNLDEPTLADWQINLDDWQKTTGEDGTAIFYNVKPNQIHWLSEVQQEDWKLSGIWCDNRSIRESRINDIQIDGIQENGGFGIYLYPGQEVHCYIGNVHDGLLNLQKTNDQPNPVPVSTTVTYTLTVTIPEESGVVCDVVVKDVAPANFAYVSGSFTANSSVRGNLKALLITSDPAYVGGIGEWIVGTMVPGEVVTLTYQTVIENDVSPGTYPDTAFAEGDNCPGHCEEPEVIFSNLSHSETPFVGTQIVVVSKGTPQVLGVATLANTGTPISAYQYVLPAILMGVTVLVTRRRGLKGGRA